MKKEITLGSVCELISGFAFKSADFIEKGVPLIRISNIRDNEIVVDDDINMPSNYATQYSRFLVKNGDILIALSGATTGKYGIYNSNKEVLLNQRVGLIRAHRDKIEKNYLFHYLNLLQNKIFNNAQGAAQPNISTNEIANFNIPYPPLLTQKRIAEILDKADALRKRDKQLLQYYDELAQSLFIDMFGDPVRNEKGWEKQSLAEVFTSFKYGTNEKSGDNKEGTIPVLRIPNVVGDSISLKDLKYSNLSAKEIKTTSLIRGDLLFVRTNGNQNYIGRSAVFNLDGQYSYASYLIRARMKEENYPFSIYIQYALSHKSYRPIIFKKATTTAGNYNINTDALKSLIIQCPRQSVLNQFAAQIQNIEQQKEKLKAQMQESENLFLALLQKAFNGGLN